MKIRDQWGLVKEMVHPQRMQNVVMRLDGPLQSVQPYKQLCSGHHNELSAQFKPSPKTIKRKSTTPKAMYLPERPIMSSCYVHVELRTLA